MTLKENNYRCGRNRAELQLPTISDRTVLVKPESDFDWNRRWHGRTARSKSCLEAPFCLHRLNRYLIKSVPETFDNLNVCRMTIWLNNDPNLGAKEVKDKMEQLRYVIALETKQWSDIYTFLRSGQRKVVHERNTHETKIKIDLNIDGSGQASINTGLGFFDHMLEQIARHGKMDLSITTKGDLHIDEHHTIEDTGIALGEAFAKALTDKRGMERYGFALPMDEADAKVLIDFGGRSWIVWNAEFMREKIGEMPTEMFFHFFKSFSDAARCNLNITCHGVNEHHKIEAIFKAFAKAIRMAVKKDPLSNYLPSTKGVL